MSIRFVKKKAQRMENIKHVSMFLVYKGTYIINLTIASHPISVDGLNTLTPIRLYIFIARYLS